MPDITPTHEPDSATAHANVGTILPIPHARLAPWDGNPRRRSDDAALAELADSLAARGVLENLVVRRDPRAKDRYLIVAGERRWRAAGRLSAAKGWPADATLPCKVVEASDVDALLFALIENLQREDMNPMDEAEAFARLEAGGLTSAQIAERIGKSLRHVQQGLALAKKLAKPVQDALRQNKIRMVEARALTTTPDPKRQVELMKRIERGLLAGEERVKQAVVERLHPVDRWPLFGPALYKGGFVDDPDTPGRRFFADTAQAEKLQREAIEARIEALKVKWPWVKVMKPYDFADWQWEKSADKAKAGCVVTVEYDGLSIKVREGLIPKSEGGSRRASAKREAGTKETTPAEPATRSHWEHARRRKTHVLQTAVAAKPLVAARLVILGLLGARDVKIAADEFGPQDPPPAPAVIAVLQKHLPKLGFKTDDIDDRVPDLHALDDDELDKLRDKLPDGVYAEDVLQERMFQALVKMPDADVMVLFTALVAAHVGTWNGHAGWPGDKPLPLIVAKHLGLAGAEARYGLNLRVEDLENVRGAAVNGVARALVVPRGATGKATKAAIAAAIAKDGAKHDYVLPSLRFADRPTVERDMAALMQSPKAKPPAGAPVGKKAKKLGRVAPGGAPSSKARAGARDDVTGAIRRVNAARQKAKKTTVAKKPTKKTAAKKPATKKTAA